MAAAWAWARTELRRSLKATIALVLAVAVGGAVVLTATAGARRTDSAFERFLAASDAADLRVQYASESDIDDEVLERTTRHPAVEAVSQIYISLLAGESDFDIGMITSPDGGILRDIDRPRLIEGRLADPTAVDEVVASEATASRIAGGLEVGERFSVTTLTAEQLAEESFEDGALGPEVELELVGITRSPEDLSRQDFTVVYGTPAFDARYGERIGRYGPQLDIALADGADPKAVVDEVFEGLDVIEVIPETTANYSDRIVDGTGVLANGLLAFAACAGLAALVACSQAINRRLVAAAPDQAALRSMGFTRGQRFAGSIFAILPVAVGGALLAVVFAVAGSVYMPIGLARQADPDLGVDVDPLVLGLGCVVVAAAALLAGVVSAWRVSGRADGASPVLRGRGRARRSAGAATAAKAGWSPAAVLGITMALEPGRGRTAVPVRPAIIGAVVGIAGVVGALTFASSLDGLVDEPARYGWNWTLSPEVFEEDLETLSSIDGVRDVAALDYAQVDIGGQQVVGMAMTAVQGAPSFTLVDGRLPSAGGEVALGPVTADRLGASIGDDVTVATEDGERSLQLVGEVLLPVIDDNPFNEGAAMALDDLDSGRQSEGDTRVIVGFEPGISEADAARRVTEVLPDSLSIYAYPTPPGDVANLDRVRGIPRALAVFLVVVALAAVGHALATAVRRRRRDLGIVRSLGFLRREVLTTIGIQSATLLTIGLVVGLPLGVALGRVVWTIVANGLGIPAEPAVPTFALATIVPVAMLAAVAVAAIPAISAARQRAAQALRAE